ncbi:MAG: RNA 2',3'-cyclic phosphodiesterase [Deltaproteobacteria bacterium]|nr:RNA 2',3'-cyclic phosphodiesterase [Deltaproteobacteria bacterium]
MKTLRTFLAVPLGQNVIKAIDTIRSELVSVLPDVRWVSPETMHLTIKFFGDIPSQDIDKIKTAMQPLQKELESFETDISGLGAFPSLSRPRVIWLGVKNQAAFKRLHSAVEKELSCIGFEQDERPFSPHLTLGRVKKPIPSADRLLEKYRHVYCGKMKADRLVLFESRLNPRGAVHLPLFSITLGDSLSEDLETD